MLVTILLAVAIQSATPATDNPPAAKPEKPICRTSAVTGSRLGRSRVCRTRAEWQEIDAITNREDNQIRNAAPSGSR